MIETWPNEIMEELLQIFNGTIPESHIFYAHSGTPTRAQLYDFIKRYKQGDLENRKELDLWKDFLNVYTYYVANRKFNSLNLSELRTNSGYDTYLASLSDLINNTGSTYVTDIQVNAIAEDIALGTLDLNAYNFIIKQIVPGPLQTSGYWVAGTLSGDGDTLISARRYNSTAAISRDSGLNWSEFTVPGATNKTYKFITNFDGNTIIALDTGISEDIVNYSIDGGLNWITLPALPTGTAALVSGFNSGWVSDDSSIIRLISATGEFLLEYSSGSWSTLTNPYTQTAVVFSEYASLNNPIILNNVEGDTCIIINDNKIFISKDGCRNWSLQEIQFSGYWSSASMSHNTNSIVICDGNDAAHIVSYDGGATWNNLVLPTDLLSDYLQVNISYDGKQLFGFVQGSNNEAVLGYSPDRGATWTRNVLSTAGVGELLQWQDLGNNGVTYVLAARNTTSTLRTGDSGQNWHLSSTVGAVL